MLMEKIEISFDECSKLGNAKVYPSASMLDFLALAETSFENIFLSLQQVIDGMSVDKNVKPPEEGEYAQKMEARDTSYIR